MAKTFLQIICLKIGDYMSNDEFRKQMMEKGLTYEEANEIIKRRRKRAKQYRREWKATHPNQNFVSYSPGTILDSGNDLY